MNLELFFESFDGDFDLPIASFLLVVMGMLMVIGIITLLDERTYILQTESLTQDLTQCHQQLNQSILIPDWCLGPTVTMHCNITAEELEQRMNGTEVSE